MDRRDSIKSIVLGSIAGGLLLNGCNPSTEEAVNARLKEEEKKYFGRTPEEEELIAELNAEQFFNAHEIATISVLCNLILPPNEKYGGPTEAEVPAFIEFMAKDYPRFQITLRGGLMWLDHKCNTEFGTEFRNTLALQQKEILDLIAYPDPEIPENKQPLEIQFFSLMRNLTLTGYYTSKIGIEDLGYKGNQPNIWDGVPEDVLQQHGIAYEEEWLAKCIDQSKRFDIAEWDDEGNLTT